MKSDCCNTSHFVYLLHALHNQWHMALQFELTTCLAFWNVACLHQRETYKCSCIYLIFACIRSLVMYNMYLDTQYSEVCLKFQDSSHRLLCVCMFMRWISICFECLRSLFRSTFRIWSSCSLLRCDCQPNSWITYLVLDILSSFKRNLSFLICHLY